MDVSILTQRKNGFNKTISFYGSDPLDRLADRLSTDQIIEIVFYIDSLKKGFTYSREISE